MQCNQLVQLIKDWYIHVKEETMAPARMMQFVDKHVSECETCQLDLDLQQEIEKIRTFVVPESKIPKAIRIKPESGETIIPPKQDHKAEDQQAENNDQEDEETQKNEGDDETQEDEGDDDQKITKSEELNDELINPDKP